MKYVKPEIEDYGTLEELTATLSAQCSDNLGGNVGGTTLSAFNSFFGTNLSKCSAVVTF